MKKYILIAIYFLNLCAYSQESIFDSFNKKGIGEINIKGQYFFMDRIQMQQLKKEQDYSIYATSFAFTFDYESPKIENFSLNLSYVHSFEIGEAGLGISNPAEKLQNSAFQILNNIYINYSLDNLGLNDAIISIGRMPVDTEYTTRYNIRQKEQAYQGVVLKIPHIGNWDVQLGYLDKFSDWTTTANNFKPIESFFSNSSNQNLNGYQFVEGDYSSTTKNTSLTAYYSRIENSWSSLGFSYLQKIGSVYNTDVHVRFKNIVQWYDTEDTKGKIAANGWQIGTLFKYQESFTIEPGFFSSWALDSVGRVQVPFGPKLIPSEPLYEIDRGYEKGSFSYYLESSYRFKKGKIYVLYFHTQNKEENMKAIYRELDMIVSYSIFKNLQTSVKLALFNENRNHINNQLIDFRLFLSYIF